MAEVHAPDDWFIKGGADAVALKQALGGATVVEVRRAGKLLMLDLVSAPHKATMPDRPDRAIDPVPGAHTGARSRLLPDVVLGVRFGMTGRLEVDGHAVIDRLVYGSVRDVPQWRRFGLEFSDGGALVVIDPRRLGGVELEPDEHGLGPDALALTPEQLAVALEGSHSPLKARLLDQRRVAGLGNLLVDEILWRAGLDPARESKSLSPAEHQRLAREISATLAELAERGGSHTGDLQVARIRGGSCPRDAELLDRRTIGGRTTYSCPYHQR